MTKIGRDMFASVAEQAFEHFDLDKSYLLRSENQGTGVALIIVDDVGKNAIAVIPGACTGISVDEVYTNARIF